MAFQKSVNTYFAPGVEGAFASENPRSTVLSTEGFLRSGVGGVTVGSFAWVTSGLAYNYNLAGAVPTGFVANSQQALITIWKGRDTLNVPVGLPVTLFDRGDFWAKTLYTDADLNQKVYANLFTGEILAAATGAFPVNPAGVSGTITASFATNVMTVTSTSVYIAPGMLVTGTSIPDNTYVMAQLTGSAGSTGTYSLTTYPGTVGSSAAVVVTQNTGVGGATASSCSANSGSTTLTITTLTNGTIAAGQIVKHANIPTGTYISALGTSTGGTGTVTLSAATTDTITTSEVLFSSWIETPFYVKTPGNVGDLIKIGIRN